MAFSHSFSPEFYGDPYSCGPTERPTNLADAIASMSDKAWDDMAADVFGCADRSDVLDVETVFAQAIETDTVSNLDSPVCVWIDSEGYYTVDVYDVKRIR